MIVEQPQRKGNWSKLTAPEVGSQLIYASSGEYDIALTVYVIERQNAEHGVFPVDEREKGPSHIQDRGNVPVSGLQYTRSAARSSVKRSTYLDAFWLPCRARRVAKENSFIRIRTIKPRLFLEASRPDKILDRESLPSTSSLRF